jgi:hypothetical protein
MHLVPCVDELQSLSWTQPPPSCGGGGGASDATSECASRCADPVSWDEESIADVESIPAPLSTVALTSGPAAPSPPTLPSLLSSRPAPLRPQAASSTPSTHDSARVGPILDEGTASRMKDSGAPVDGTSQNEPDQAAP